MPGLAGIVTSAPLRSARRTLEALKTAALVTGVDYQYRTYSHSQAAILNILTGLLPETHHQPAVDGSGYRRLFLEGEIFNLGEVRSRTGCSGTTTACDALLALYSKLGHGFTSCLNGEFNIVVHDQLENRIDIFSDHLASYPMYYMERPGCFLFGSEKKFILALLDSSPALDPLGVLQLVAHRHNLGERTILAGIGRMMPNAQVTCRPGRSLRVRRREPATPETVGGRTADLREEWIQKLNEATRRRLAGKSRVILSLSGGLDSRAAACAIRQQYEPVWSRTRGVQGAPETEVAAAVADRLGFKHIREDPADVSLSSLVPMIAWRTECETSFLNALSIGHHPLLWHHFDFIAGGWLGDVSSGAHIGPDMLLPMERSTFIERVYARCMQPAGPMLARVFTQAFLRKALPRLRDAFTESFSGLEKLPNVRAYETWDFNERQRRQTTSSMPIDSYLFEKIRPFYDRDYLKFTMALPLRLRFGQTLYQSVIYEMAPELRDVVSANNNRRLRKTVAGNLGVKVATLCRRRMHARRGRTAAGAAAVAAPVENPGEAMRRDPEFQRLIRRFLRSDHCNDEFFDRAAIGSMLKEHCSGLADHSYLLGHVATFAAGLPYLVQPAVRCPPEAEPLAHLAPAARAAMPDRRMQHKAS